jgi:hypothetical protein
MNKPGYPQPRALAEVLRKTLDEAFAKQGFASAEIVTRWAEIVGPEIAAHSEPERIRWQRSVGDEPPQPGILMLRVEGPTAIEIQHLGRIILERVNQFFGWKAVGGLRLRQAPLGRQGTKRQARADPEKAGRIAATLGGIESESLRAALARLGATIGEP